MPVRLWTKDDWQDREQLKQGFIRHNANVRERVPKGNLLEWVPEDGFEPICQFLGKPVPKEGFPNINKGSSAAQLHKSLIALRAIEMFIFSPWPLISGAVAIAAWWCMKQAS
jgi:hypothetical protein